MRHRGFRLLPFACLLLAGGHVLPAWPQSANTGADTRAGVYLPDYFSDVSPANAYDMVQRLPGFSVVEPDADVRGYAGASGNVLFDGARPTSKRDSYAELLKRIPARAVERIELVYASRPGIDMAGYSVLANIVRRKEASVECAIESGAMVSTDGWAEPQAEVEYGRRWDERALDLSFNYSPKLDDDSGRGHITTHAAGEPERTDVLDTRADKRKVEASANWRQPLAGGRLTLTAARRGEAGSTRTRIGSGEDAERVSAREDFREAELGARFVRQFAGRTTLEAMASWQRGDQDNREDSREPGELENFEEAVDSGETIVRLDLTHAYTDAVSINMGLEGAQNFLDVSSLLQENGVPIVLPGSDVRIEEQRLEASIGMTWQPTSAWSLEAGMRLEQSRLSQTGDTPMERRFTYTKPRMALRWMPSDTNQWRFSLSREVGQLDFEDFGASASLDTGTVSAGNPELQPDQSWRAVIGWEHHFSDDAALTLSWTHDRISDVVDRVLVVDGDDVFDAPGNIGDGRRNTLAMDFSAPLAPWGMTGVRLRSALLWRDSSLTDPVTAQKRGISEEKPFVGEIELSQDLPDLRMSWGVLLEHLGERETKYRYDRITRESEAAGWTLYVERHLGDHWRFRAEATDLLGRTFRERRIKYDGIRGDGPAEEVEVRNRKSPGYIGFTVRRSMGN